MGIFKTLEKNRSHSPNETIVVPYFVILFILCMFQTVEVITGL